LGRVGKIKRNNFFTFKFTFSFGAKAEKENSPLKSRPAICAGGRASLRASLQSRLFYQRTVEFKNLVKNKFLTPNP